MSLLFLPDWLIAYANIFALLIVGNLAETEYVSRLALFTNGVALSVHALINLSDGFFGSGIIGAVVAIYVLSGFVSGTIAIIAYYEQESLPQLYYDLNYDVYRSETVAVVILATGILEHLL